MLLSCSIFLQGAVASDASTIIKILADTYSLQAAQLPYLELLNGLSEDQLEVLTSVLEAETGHYDYGKILNSDEDLTNREWSPSDWQSALQGLSGGNPDRYQELLEQYIKDHPSVSIDDMKLGVSDSYATDYQQTVQVNQAANVQASYEFNDINEHLKNIKTISNEIEGADNEKAISDLNVRMNTEIAYLMVEEIKMLSLLNQQYAQSIASQLVDKISASKFNQLPKEVV